MPATEREARVAEAVRDLVHRSADFDPLELLHDLTEHATPLLPVAGAGVTVLDDLGRVEYATASDERCRRLEEVQIELDEGPCLDATRGGTATAPASLAGPAALRRPTPPPPASATSTICTTKPSSSSSCPPRWRAVW